MDTRLQDCPHCGASASVRMVHERFGDQTWWCVVCEYDWTARADAQQGDDDAVAVRKTGRFL